MSFGAAASEPGKFNYEQIFAAADLALYEAKRAGRNRVHTAARVDDASLALAR
jgi:PleD family two-component response regulator